MSSAAIGALRTLTTAGRANVRRSEPPQQPHAVHTHSGLSVRHQGRFLQADGTCRRDRHWGGVLWHLLSGALASSWHLWTGAQWTKDLRLVRCWFLHAQLRLPILEGGRAVGFLSACYPDSVIER